MMPPTRLPSRLVDRSAGELLGKPALVEFSHAIEQFALAAAPGEPLIVIAMFQKLSYFARALPVYEAIADRGAVTLVGMAEDVPPLLPPGIHHALVPASDSLAREWSITVLGPHGGATLVAVDLETLDPVARTIEEGRQFCGRWSFRRDDAFHEVLRLRSQLRLTPAVVGQIDAVLRAVQVRPEPAHQDWWGVPARFLAHRMEAAVRARTAAEVALEAVAEDRGERDPRTGLYTEKFLDRWTAGLGAGTLPIGLALLRVFGIAEVRADYGLRAELAALHGVSGCVQDLLTRVDRVVRIGREDFLVVLPSSPPEKVMWFCQEVCERVARLEDVYPFIALPGVAAATVTRSRPLPIQQLVEQVELGGRESEPVSLLAD
jgi:GGDEF domain-containing protein